MLSTQPSTSVSSSAASHIEKSKEINLTEQHEKAEKIEEDTGPTDAEQVEIGKKKVARHKWMMTAFVFSAK